MTPDLRRIFLGITLFIAACAAYLGNGETITSYDSAPSTLFAFNALENHTLNYDAFRASYFNSIGGGYAFVEAPNGHLTSLFPIGTSLLTFPMFSALYALRTLQTGPPPIVSPQFEDERRHDEKLVAAIVAACAVVLFYFTARLFASPFQAGIATFVFGFAGEMWTIGSQGLWQHGPVNLILLSAIFSVLNAAKQPLSRPNTWLVVTGLCAGALPTIRPTAALFSIAIFVFILAERRLRAAWQSVALGMVIGLAPSLAWNAIYFHSLS